MNKDLFGKKLNVVNIGLESFASDLRFQNVEVTHVRWQPPAGGDLKLLKDLEKLDTAVVEKANKRALENILNSRPKLVDIRPAIEVIPGMKKNMLLHAGPPITWQRMCGPVRGAMMGALVYENIASTSEEAEKMLMSGEIKFSPCHDHNAVGPMAGVVSASMPVFVVENYVSNKKSFCTMNEGLGNVLRFGAYSDEVIEKLKWMEGTLFPSLKTAILDCGGVDLINIISQALHMGDECHNRNAAATSLFIRQITPHLISTCDRTVLRKVFEFMTGNNHFFLNISMAACKSIMDSAHGIKNSTIVTAMARNGTDFGIRVSGLGDEWFTAEALIPKGLYFSGFTEDDANPDLGDSSITETTGIGGFAMACAPAIVKFVGGSADDALNHTKEMGEITLSKSKSFTIPALNFEGTPTGIDVRKVLKSGVAPFINTGIAHKQPGIGQIGAGIVRAPMECFTKAAKAMVLKLS